LKLDRFNKETKVSDNKKAIKLLRDAVSSWKPSSSSAWRTKPRRRSRKRTDGDGLEARSSQLVDVYAWPFTQLFKEMSDKVEIFDFEKYNFVTPIIKPEAMDRAELLDRVMNNYRRFYMYKALFSYPWRALDNGVVTSWVA